jgi:serine/threonine protein kinase
MGRSSWFFSRSEKKMPDDNSHFLKIVKDVIKEMKEKSLTHLVKESEVLKGKERKDELIDRLELDPLDPSEIDSKEKIEIVYNTNTSTFYLLGKQLGQGGFGAAYLIYPIQVKNEQIDIDDQSPAVIKKMNVHPGIDMTAAILKEAAGLSKLYSGIDYILTDRYSYIFSPFFPGSPLIREQELANGTLTLHKDIEKLSFTQRLFVISEMARQLYRVHTPSLNEALPDNGEARIHGDIKGSNFHLYVDEKGFIQVFLFDFGTSEKVILENGSPLPTTADNFSGSFGHITKNMLSSDVIPPFSNSRIYKKTIGDDIHNLTPIIGCLLGASNPYYDKARAVYKAVIEEEVQKYDMYAVDDIREFKLPEEKKPAIVFAKENGCYHVFYYNHRLKSLITAGNDDTYLNYPLDDIEEEKKLAQGEFSLIDKSNFIYNALILKGDFAYNKIKVKTHHYLAEHTVPYALNDLYQQDVFKKGNNTKEYAKTFLRRMQGIDDMSWQADSFETRLFWGCLHYFSKKSTDDKFVKEEWKSTFDILMTDVLQNNNSPRMRQFRKIVELFFARVDADNLQETMKDEMDLFWETVHQFLSTYHQSSSLDKNNLSILDNKTLPILSKLAVLSIPGFAKDAWGDDFKKQDELRDVRFNEVIVLLAISKNILPDMSFGSEIILRLLFSSEFSKPDADTIHDVLIKCCEDPLLHLQMQPLLKKLITGFWSHSGPLFDEAIELARNVLAVSEFSLKSISVKEFNLKYDEIKESKEYNASFLDYLTRQIRFNAQHKKELEELKQTVLSSQDDFERFKLIDAFVNKNPLSPITQRLGSLVKQTIIQFSEKKRDRSFEL